MRRPVPLRLILRDASNSWQVPTVRCSSESDSIFMPMISGSCQAAGKDANASKEHPGLRAGDCFLKVFRQTSAAIEPSKGSFDHPALWLSFKCTDTLRSCNDLDKPLAELRGRQGKLLPAIHAVSKDVTQIGKDEANVFQQWDRAVDILYIGRVHLQGQQ